MINLIYYFFVLESEGFTYDLEEIMDSRIDKDIPLTKLEVKILLMIIKMMMNKYKI